MSSWLYALLIAGSVWFGAVLLVVMAAFRTSVKWGLITTFVPGLGMIAFGAKHWARAGKPLLLALAGCFAFVAVLVTHREILASHVPSKYARLADAWQSLTTQPPPPIPVAQQKQMTAAAAEAQLAQRDELLEREAVYHRHAAEVNTTYTQLAAARAKLKTGGSAVTAFNAKAAAYQQSVASLQAEKASYDALERTVHAADLAARAATQRVVNVATSPVTTSAGAAEAPATRADLDAAVARIRAIVNQVPSIVIKPKGETGWIEGFHPGASKPDFDHTDIVGGRQPYNVAYIQMEGVPDVFYLGAQCEFNSQTKFFYTHREQPKKKLSDAEYAELVRLYRFVGKCERDLNVSL